MRGAISAWRLLPAAFLAAPVALLGSPRTTTVSAAPATPCAAIAATEPQNGHTMPPQANWLFAADFPQLDDCEWGYLLGGWGGQRALAPLHHTPVIFVHGNQADAENWYLVADQFKAQAGYSDQELYAVSYNGLENGAAGMPTCCSPAPESQAYWQMGNNPPTAPNPPFYEFCCNGGHGASDDTNIPDLYAFVQAVQQYTGSQSIDFVAHSLGVTIVRKLLYDHPQLRTDVLAAVVIAGANHGTTVCRDLATTYYGCDEIAPGTTWLEQLNSVGESPGPTHWMSVYNGTDNTDPFFQAVPGNFDDTTSPHLEGADYNIACPQTYHNDLRVRPDIVSTYLDFVLRYGQDSSLALTNPPAVVPSSSCNLVNGPAAEVPDAAAVPLLLVTAGVAGAGLSWSRRRRRARGYVDGTGGSSPAPSSSPVSMSGPSRLA